LQCGGHGAGLSPDKALGWEDRQFSEGWAARTSPRGQFQIWAHTSIYRQIFGASLKWLNFRYFSHLTPKMSLILAVSSHFTITPVLARNKFAQKWNIKGAVAPIWKPKWEKSLVEIAPLVSNLNINTLE